MSSSLLSSPSLFALHPSFSGQRSLWSCTFFVAADPAEGRGAHALREVNGTVCRKRHHPHVWHAVGVVSRCHVAIEPRVGKKKKQNATPLLETRRTSTCPHDSKRTRPHQTLWTAATLVFSSWFVRVRARERACASACACAWFVSVPRRHVLLSADPFHTASSPQFDVALLPHPSKFVTGWRSMQSGRAHDIKTRGLGVMSHEPSAECCD